MCLQVSRASTFWQCLCGVALFAYDKDKENILHFENVKYGSNANILLMLNILKNKHIYKCVFTYCIKANI